eukprot:TRINITY_DN1208_c0_g2_i2.p1 TRINITY_DN1208_c0_g2~~TRINITY_DN1208_c0_g2_i2.p1  ORF type:complete len:281 (-),score=22.58 TRINITY_DN1208_c0_g2_i2:144-869(-)
MIPLVVGSKLGVSENLCYGSQVSACPSATYSGPGGDDKMVTVSTSLLWDNSKNSPIAASTVSSTYYSGLQIEIYYYCANVGVQTAWMNIDGTFANSAPISNCNCLPYCLQITVGSDSSRVRPKPALAIGSKLGGSENLCYGTPVSACPPLSYDGPDNNGLMVTTWASLLWDTQMNSPVVASTISSPYYQGLQLEIFYYCESVGIQSVWLSMGGTMANSTPIVNCNCLPYCLQMTAAIDASK